MLNNDPNIKTECFLLIFLLKILIKYKIFLPNFLYCRALRSIQEYLSDKVGTKTILKLWLITQYRRHIHSRAAEQRCQLRRVPWADTPKVSSIAPTHAPYFLNLVINFKHSKSGSKQRDHFSIVKYAWALRAGWGILYAPKCYLTQDRTGIILIKFIT